MKITKHRLQEIIKEELFYREFYRDSKIITEARLELNFPRVNAIMERIEKLDQRTELPELLQRLQAKGLVPPPPG